MLDTIYRRRPDRASAKSQITGTLVDGQTILPNHWQARRRTEFGESLPRVVGCVHSHSSNRESKSKQQQAKAEGPNHDANYGSGTALEIESATSVLRYITALTILRFILSIGVAFVWLR